MARSDSTAPEALSAPEVPSNPLVTSSMPVDTVDAAVAVLAYMRDYLARTRTSVHRDDIEERIEYGRFLMLSTVEEALQHASEAMKAEPVRPTMEAVPADTVLQ